MNQPLRARPGRAILSAFGFGALWGAAVAAFESILVNHALQIGIQRPLALLELVVNYALYAGVGTVVLYIVLDVLLRRRTRGSHGESADSHAAASEKPRGATSVAEAIVGSGFLVGAIATYLQKGLWGVHALTWPLALGIGVGGTIAVVLLVRGLRRLSVRGVRVLRVGLVMSVILGFLWMPLFGPYTGRLRNRQPGTPAKGAKNVLLILIDTLRADYLDCYGGDWRASPVINRLAAEGAVFEDNIGQSTWTLPGTTCILTGLFPSSHGAVATGMSLASTAPTLAEALQRAGYRTGAFTENQYIRPQCGFGRGFGYFWTYWLPWAFQSSSLNRVLANVRLPTIEFTNKDAYVTVPDITDPDDVNWDARVATDAVLKWLRRDPDSPFFAFVHYMGPHGPYGPREYLLDHAAPSTRLTDYPRPMGGAFPLGEPAGAATDQELEDMKALYAADILCVDRHIGRIVEWLEDTGKLSETLVVITADHGEEFLEHGSWCHGSSVFTEVARVPFIVYGDGLVPAGTRICDITRQIDLMPTVLDLLGLDCPKEIQGRSVRPLLDGAPLPHQPAYVEVYPAVPPGADIFGLVTDRHKIVRVTLDDRSAVLLYDREDDPEELVNIADSCPALRDSLLVEMEKWDQIARANSPIDPERLRYFRSLGYINQ